MELAIKSTEKLKEIMDEVYMMSETKKLPVKEWDVAIVLNRIKQLAGIELSIYGNDISSYKTEKIEKPEQ